MTHPPRPAARAGAPRHRAPARPRYARITLLCSAASVTAVSVLAGWGVLPTDPADAGVAGGLSETAATTTLGTLRPDALPSVPSSSAPPSAPAPATSSDRLPVGSGSGRRVVFSETAQRVWLVEADGTVARTYLVSGSVEDNLHPGTYEVYSRSRHAYGIEDSGTMEWFVRFTRGPSGAAIGFHDIPVKGGLPLQTRAQLGTPQSHGCIRQRERDARALWRFAALGTTAVVV